MAWGPGGPAGPIAPLFALFVLMAVAAAKKNEYYQMETLCKHHFLQKIYKKIDGALLESRNERNLECTFTFQTHSILQRFMLRFDYLQLDCSDHLYVYDGVNPMGAHKADLSCRDTKQSVGAMFTGTNYVSLRYVTDNWGPDSNGFRLVITSVKDPKHSCRDFRCKLKEYCIDLDLTCDGINHCADGSDEVCPSKDAGTILGLEVTWFVVVTVCTLLMLLVVAVAVSMCACCKRPVSRQNGAAPVQGAEYPRQMYGSNGAMKGPMIGPTTTLPLQNQGNWVHPAGRTLGYRLTLVRALLCCLAN